MAQEKFGCWSRPILGVPRNKTLETRNLSEARAELAERRGNIKKPRKGGKTLQAAHEYAFKLCEALDVHHKSLPTGSPERKLALEAYHAADKARQKIIQLAA